MSPKEHAAMLETLYSRAVKLAYKGVNRCADLVKTPEGIDQAELIRKETLKELKSMKPQLLAAQERGIITEEHLGQLEHLVNMGEEICWRTSALIGVYRDQIDIAAKMMPKMVISNPPVNTESSVNSGSTPSAGYASSNFNQRIQKTDLPVNYKPRHPGSLLDGCYSRFLL